MELIALIISLVALLIFIWDKFSNKNKFSYQELASITAKNEALLQENSNLKKNLTRFELEFWRQINDLENARKSLEDEKKRIRKEDEDKKHELEALRDRIWAEHEDKVISNLRDICSKKEFNFQVFSNKDLPNEFDWSFKPDFMILHLGEYIIFDAKMSKSSQIDTYLASQIKETVRKIKTSKANIHKTIFFVIPSWECVRKTHYFEEGFNFYIITPECFEPILATFKKIQEYDLAEELIPQERENIISLIAILSSHISQRNAIDQINSQEWQKVLFTQQSLSSDLIEAINIKKNQLRIKRISENDIKKNIYSDI